MDVFFMTLPLPAAIWLHAFIFLPQALGTAVCQSYSALHALNAARVSLMLPRGKGGGGAIQRAGLTWDADRMAYCRERLARQVGGQGGSEHG